MAGPLASQGVKNHPHSKLYSMKTTEIQISHFLEVSEVGALLFCNAQWRQSPVTKLNPPSETNQTFLWGLAHIKAMRENGHCDAQTCCDQEEAHSKEVTIPTNKCSVRPTSHGTIRTLQLSSSKQPLFTPWLPPFFEAELPWSSRAPKEKSCADLSLSTYELLLSRLQSHKMLQLMQSLSEANGSVHTWSAELGWIRVAAPFSPGSEAHRLLLNTVSPLFNVGFFLLDYPSLPGFTAVLSTGCHCLSPVRDTVGAGRGVRKITSKHINIIKKFSISTQ